MSCFEEELVKMRLFCFKEISHSLRLFNSSMSLNLNFYLFCAKTDKRMIVFVMETKVKLEHYYAY